MAFSLFKKKDFADTILTNAKIRTFDPDYPLASCAAIRSGELVAVGEGGIAEDFAGKDTKILDLQGKWVLPGFIAVCSEFSQDIFRGTYIPLSEEMDRGAALEAIGAYAASHPQESCYFAFGFESALFDEISEEEAEAFREELDRVCRGVPAILLSSDGLSMRLSGAAAKAAKEAADEQGLPFLTQSFVLDTLFAPDYASCTLPLMRAAEDYASRGFTSVLNTTRASYFGGLTRDLLMNAYQAGVLKQRYFGAYTVSRPVQVETVLAEMDRNFTYCQELSPWINARQLIIRADSKAGSPHAIPPERIEAYARACAEKGYHVRFVPLDAETDLLMRDIAGDLADRNKRLSFTVVSDAELSEEALASTASGSEYRLGLGEQIENVKPQEGQSFGEAASRFYTQTAAAILGIGPHAGTVEEGKWADLAVFSEDPFEAEDAETFLSLRADTVLLAGEIVYE